MVVVKWRYRKLPGHIPVRGTPGRTRHATRSLILKQDKRKNCNRGNTAIFSLMDKLLLEALPLECPRELVLVNPRGFQNGLDGRGHDAVVPGVHRISR